MSLQFQRTPALLCSLFAFFVLIIAQMLYGFDEKNAHSHVFLSVREADKKYSLLIWVQVLEKGESSEEE